MKIKVIPAVIAVVMICGCDVSERDIRRYGIRGDVDLLVRTIEKGYEKPKHDKKVKLAIDQLVRRKDNEVWNYLVYRFDRGFSDDLIRYTLQTPSSTADLNTLQKQFLQHIQETDYTKAEKWLSIAHRVGIADESIPITVQEQLPIIRTTYSRMDSLINLKREVERSIKSYQDKIESARDTQKKYFLLQGYIVAEVDLGLYEITYLGSRAYLMTTETRFESQGRFNLWVSELIEVPVTLRQEFGGFTQQWKVYREAPRHELIKRHEAGTKIGTAEDSIEVRELRLANLEPLISNQDDVYKTALSRLDSALVETFGQSNVSVEQ